MELMIIVGFGAFVLGILAGMVQVFQDMRERRSTSNGDRRALKGLGMAVDLARQERICPAVFDHEAGHTSWKGREAVERQRATARRGTRPRARLF